MNVASENIDRPRPATIRPRLRTQHAGNPSALRPFSMISEFIMETVMSRISTLAVLTILAAATAACGDRPVDRALTGGAIGAGGGALVGSAVGNPVAGAVVGGLGGAAIGAATAPSNRYD
ncbi:MAG: hypothetical protein Q8L19_13335 [Reyranella sp.]|nr:hypothetical protein [Reyranella sp.]